MFASVDFVRERLEDVLVVPHRAVLMLEGQPTLFTVNGGQSHRRQVSLGVELSGQVVVTSGISVGDTVVTLGQDFLEEEMLVNVTALNGQKR
jgi:multidrug efflux pump subunit AcrA (membrane-fusion protein)